LPLTVYSMHQAEAEGALHFQPTHQAWLAETHYLPHSRYSAALLVLAL
jgi:hypothetical protein